jgi:hypothetical protein
MTLTRRSFLRSAVAAFALGIAARIDLTPSLPAPTKPRLVGFYAYQTVGYATAGPVILQNAEF